MEVGKMPAQRKTNQSRGLTAAGLIAVTAATLLMMAWAIFPTPAVAILPGVAGNCPLGGTTLPGPSGSTTVNGVTISYSGQSVTISGGTATLCVKAGNVNSGVLTLGAGTHLIVEWAAGNDPNEAGPPFPAISHIQVYSATSTSPPTPASITVVKQTNPDGSAQKFEFDTNYGSNFSLADGEQNDSGNLVPGTYSVAEVNIPAGWSLTSATCSDQSNPNSINLAAGEHVTCTFTNTQSATTTTPGGGGGGGTTTTPPPAPTTTTTTPPTVAPTTIHNTSTTPAAEVLPTTVRPGKLAFTGIEDVVPIGALALTLMTTGSGLLWAGSRRRRHDGSEDED
jgi:hypothetical protein